MPDIAIVGGGIIGAACAYELSRAGASVTLIERDELAAGASGRNQGWFVLPEDPLLEPMARATLPTYLDVAASAALPVWIDREPVGHLLVALDGDDVPRAQDALTAATAQGVAIRELDAAELHEVEPAVSSDAVAGWLLDQGHRLDPAALTVALALAAKAASADIRHHVRVRAFVHDGDAIRGVVTDDGPVHADTVIVAAGPWSTTLLDPIGVRLPVTGARGWIVRVQPASGTLHHMIEHAGWRVGPERLADVARPSAESVATNGMPPRGCRGGPAPACGRHRPGRLVTPALGHAGARRPRRAAATAPRGDPTGSLARRRDGHLDVVGAPPDHAGRASARRDRPRRSRGRDRPRIGGRDPGRGNGAAGRPRSSLGDPPPFDPAPFDPFRFDG